MEVLWSTMRKSRLNHRIQERLIEHLVSGTTALTAASLCAVGRKAARLFFLHLRKVITLELEAESESMFGDDFKEEVCHSAGEYVRYKARTNGMGSFGGSAQARISRSLPSYERKTS